MLKYPPLTFATTAHNLLRIPPRHGRIRGMVAFVVVIPSANFPTSFPDDFGPIVDYNRGKKPFITVYCSGKLEPHPDGIYTRSRARMWYESVNSPSVRATTHCMLEPESGIQQDSGISPWSATVGTSGSLGSTKPPSQLHKHRRMSSLGQSKRRTSGAREAATRPSYARLPWQNTSLLTLSPQGYRRSHRSIYLGISGHALFVPTKVRRYPRDGRAAG